MKKIADFIVEKRIFLLVVFLIIAGFCGFLIPKVEINTDMTKYLPDDSSMKKGMDLMEKEFAGVQGDYTIRVMFTGLTDEEKISMKSKLTKIKNVDRVDYITGDAEYDKDDHTRYVLHTKYEYDSAEELAIEKDIETGFSVKDMIYRSDKLITPDLPMWVATLAVTLVTVILIIMSGSWLEPFLFLFTIGIAVAINLGTNIILGTISDKTFSIAAILQLALSMDYSIILISRYRQELPGTPDKKEAMKKAIAGAFSSIASSSFTTVVGLLVLVFMSFKIGFDMGVVLAKGVFLSVVCVLLILPGLILMFSKAIEKTSKTYPEVPTGGLARLCDKIRIPLTICFIALFVGVYFIQKNTDITFSMTTEDKIAEVFPTTSTVVFLYDNEDDEKVTEIAEELSKLECVKSAVNYSNTLGKQYTAAEMIDAIKQLSASMGGDEISGMEFDESMFNMLYYMYNIKNFSGLTPIAGPLTMSIDQLISYLNDTLIHDETMKPMLNEDMISGVTQYAEVLKDGIKQLKTEKYSRLILSVTIPDEGPETESFYKLVNDMCKDLENEYYLIGASAMNYEMSLSFGGEQLLITLLTAAAIFLVVLITFRSVIVPVILVLLVQCGVYITISIIGFQGYGIYFIALLIVQCILMGSTIDYGILFSNYYRESRKNFGRADALKKAYAGSMHTILTSGLIIVTITGILGQCYGEPTVEQICQTISIGAACAILLIIFILPGILACLDRLTGGKNRKRF